jgi:hypothetical protein
VVKQKELVGIIERELTKEMNLLATLLGLSVLFTCIYAEVHYHEFVVSSHSPYYYFILFLVCFSKVWSFCKNLNEMNKKKSVLWH